MTDEAIDVFFYGLFMDPDALRAQGFNPQNPRKAGAPDMALCIGARATLERRPGATAYGIVMTLTPTELSSLYTEPSVAAYRAEPTTAVCEDGSVVAAVSYNLPPGTAGQANGAYAARLAILAEKLDLPAAYIQMLQDLTQKD